MNLLTEKTLPDAVEMASFQLIWKIHDELRTEARADCVPGFLVDLVEGASGRVRIQFPHPVCLHCEKIA